VDEEVEPILELVIRDLLSVWDPIMSFEQNKMNEACKRDKTVFGRLDYYSQFPSHFPVLILYRCMFCHVALPAPWKTKYIPFSVDVVLGPMTCFGQWNVSRCDVPGVDMYDDLAWSFKLLWSTIRRIFPTD
jgi:hypothetical protein